jgi:NADH-quinone oxidoreductase subunit H
MSLTTLILEAVLAFLVVMFAMNVAVVLTWADRRYGAMLQDRVGPNRAVAWLPRWLAQGLLVVPAVAVAAGIIAYVFEEKVVGVDRTHRAMLFSELAVAWTWLTALVIAGRVQRRGVKNSFDRFIHALGNPRRIFYWGFGINVVVFLIAELLRGTPLGHPLREVGYGSGPAVLALAIVFGAGYAAYSLKDQERVGLRLIGLFHPAADGLKSLMKEDFIPTRADRLLHGLAPLIALFPGLVVLAVVPFGDTLCFGTLKNGQPDYGHLLAHLPASGVCVNSAFKLQVLDANVGILFFFALAGTGIVGAALAGWASDNKFSLLGGLRAASQMVSYEVTLGLTLIGAFMIYGTLRLDEMVRWQAAHAWGIFVQPLAFVLFFAAAVAESKRTPFDLPEGESEIVAGYYTEYSGMKFAMFYFSEYVAVVTSSALLVTIFLGGWSLPFIDRDGLRIVFGDTQLYWLPLTQGFVVVIGVLAFILKVLALCWVQLTIRWTLPRFRYDQLMKLGWRKILPASLGNILFTGLVVLAVQSTGASVLQGLNVAGNLTMWIVAIAGAVCFVWFVLFLLVPARKRRLLAASSARFAAQAGGTRTARMGA